MTNKGFGVKDINIGAGTSISSPAANTLTLGTNSVERVRVTGIGSVGIGTDNPTELVTVGAAITTALFEVKPHAAGYDINVSSGDFAPHFQDKFIVYNGQPGSGTERFRISSEGYVTTSSQPAALVYKTGTNQAISSDAIVNYDATSYSQGGMTINSNRNRITVPVAGKYMINASTSGSVTTASAGDGWKIRILRDGAVYNHTSGFPIETTGSETGQELAYVVSMVADAAAGDYFEIELENVGAARASMSYGYFGIYLLG